MIAALLKWTGLSQWMCDLIALGLVAIAVGFGVHHIYATGEQAELAKLTAKAEADTKKLQAQVAIAEHSHDQELNDLQSYRDAHPDTLSVCLSPGVRTPPAASRPSSPAGGSVQPVSPRDSGSGQGTAGPNIFPMLDALAARADQISAELRARQEIEP